MVIRPHIPDQKFQAHSPISAWDAVARTQKAAAASYLLIRQPDHARLAGEVARHIRLRPDVPIDEAIVEAISLHDEGWAPFDDGREPLQATPFHLANGYAVNAGGKPLSFLEIKAGDARRAWCSSIEVAENRSPIAGLLVSHHFSRIARFGLSVGYYGEGDLELIRAFQIGEEARQQRLLRIQKRTVQEVEHWTDVLQFCDLLSLYLCCGSNAWVQFPQPLFGPDRPISVQPENGAYVLSPAVFKAEADFTARSQPFPPRAGAPADQLRWRLR